MAKLKPECEGIGVSHSAGGKMQIDSNSVLVQTAIKKYHKLVGLFTQ